MNGLQHLSLNLIIITIFSIFLYYIFNWNILNLNMIHLVIAIYIFSNISDIDHSKSLISNSFFIFYFILFLYGISNIFGVKIIIGIFQIIVSVLLGYYHYTIKEDSYKHRKFPHTFTFGLFTSLILFFFTSFPIFIIGLFCFIMHIVFDKHVLDAIEKDKAFWIGFNIYR
jgi:hypothetical protein